MRRPIVSGQFYEDSFEELDKQINSCFESKFGPGALPVRRADKKIFGAIAPHAGYTYSGPCQAWTYKEIAESRFPDLFIVIGLSHSGFATCISQEDWETPFGIVKIDRDFGGALMEKGIRVNEKAHKNEHSIEVQLPFLQFVNKDRLSDIRFLPIIASDDRDYRELAEKIVKTIDETGKDAVLIASSDFTHFGASYGYMPFHTDIKKNLYELDRKAIGFIEGLRPTEFLNYTDETGATICGKLPIAVVVEACKLMGAKKARLLNYYTSGDIVGEYGSAVGYASIVIE